MKRRFGLFAAVGVAALLLTPGTAYAQPDAETTVGSPSSPFSQNKQNEPAVAINPIAPNVLVAGANDNIDLEACNAGTNNTCPFTPGIGVTGVSFSFDGGASWVQPTYSGLSARNCLGSPDPAVVDDTCTPQVGPIGTLPNYFENGLVSNGDPAAVFGPQPSAGGGFSWDNGARLYFANIATKVPGTPEGFRGPAAIAVSHTDEVVAAAAGNNDAWSDPVIATRQSTTTFSDKEFIYADNAESSQFFGNVYVCNIAFRSTSGPSEPLMVATSSDGGNTWRQRQITGSANGGGAGRSGGRQGCTLRTDADGVLYVFWNSSLNGQVAQFMSRSFDGGHNFERGRPVANVTEVGAFDAVSGRFTFDGVAGARTDSFPSVDLANGAPTGGGPGTIAMTWSDAGLGLNNERALVTVSVDGGTTWSSPVVGSEGTDRPDFPALAVSPDGTDVYLTYEAFLDPFRLTTSETRRQQGVVRHAEFDPVTGALGPFTTLHRAAIGDARGSSANGLTSEFLGDYNYAWATNDGAATVWTDVRDAAVCDAINAYRQALVDGAAATAPNVQQQCPPTFGNTDIFSFAATDPTP
ncbi:MAG TPA: sialidase family protein [Acidimicrobiales bacterium]|jgi:hypothetical protein